MPHHDSSERTSDTSPDRAIAGLLHASPFGWARHEVAERMADPLIGIADYNQRINERIAMAQASTSNRVRAQHYALAEHYLRLFEAEDRSAARSRKRC